MDSIASLLCRVSPPLRPPSRASPLAFKSLDHKPRPSFITSSLFTSVCFSFQVSAECGALGLAAGHVGMNNPGTSSSPYPPTCLVSYPFLLVFSSLLLPFIFPYPHLPSYPLSTTPIPFLFFSHPSSSSSYASHPLSHSFICLQFLLPLFLLPSLPLPSSLRILFLPPVSLPLTPTPLRAPQTRSWGPA